MTDLQLAENALSAQNLTCAAARDGRVVFTSAERGIRPIVALYDSGVGPGCAVADRVIGRAAALLLALCRARAVYGAVMSEPAAAELEAREIAPVWGETVPAIRNRAGDGLCPMEALSQGVSSPEEMLTRIRAFLAGLPKE